MEYRPFYNDWVDVSSLFDKTFHKRFIDPLYVHLDVNFFKDLSFKKEDLKQYRINAALESQKLLGDNPALCLSGGVDSQAMVLAWLEAELKFDTYILVFKNNLNVQDVDHALQFCNTYNINYKQIEIDVIQFLNRENYEYSELYDSASPHFNTHYKMFNILKDKGYSGICCGGTTPLINNDDEGWGLNFNRNPLNFINYTKISKFPCIGNFLSFYPKLAWSLALLIPPTDLLQEVYAPFHNNDRMRIEKERYDRKCLGYMKHGFNIIPQSQKYTGFELVKDYLEKLTGDGWEFEKRYRHPLEKNLNHTTGKSMFIFNKGVREIIDLLHLKNITPYN